MQRNAKAVAFRGTDAALFDRGSRSRHSWYQP